VPGSGIEFRPYVPSARPPKGDAIEMTAAQMAQILWLIEKIGQAVDLERTLDLIFSNARPLIPFNRIGLALLQEPGGRVVSKWVRSDRPVRLQEGFTGGLADSSLQTVLERREVRIINNLEQYLSEHPQSVSTRLLVEEGMQASLTCPLVVRDRPVGFLFFTSIRPGAYSDASLRFYQYMASQLSLLIEKSRLYTELAVYAQAVHKHNERVNHELELARNLQRMLVPAAPPVVPSLDLALHYQPVMQVGGDLVELSPLPDGSLLVFVADAMGHGVQAALVMSVLKGMLASALRRGTDIAAVMRQLNDDMRPLLSEYFAVAMCAHVDPANSRLRIVRAGIPPALLWQKMPARLLELCSGGLPLAVGEEAYAVEQQPFEPGDLLLIATDGLLESCDGAKEPFGEARLRETLQECAAADKPASDCLQCILRRLQQFCGDAEQGDDTTILAIRRPSVSAKP